MTLTLEHIFPELGAVEVPLYDESARIYELLETLPNSGMSHLQTLDHLGELRAVTRTTHHSRYEYLILQLHLSHFLKQRTHSLGLSTSVPVARNVVISSGEELLKCWSFLSEHGHLLGTYETERFALKMIVENDLFKDNFFRLFPDRFMRGRAVRVIRRQDLWEFYKLLSWVFLHWQRRRESDKDKKETLQFALSLIRALLTDAKQGTKLKRCQDVFKQIRRLSYLYLDLARLPVSLRFNTAIFFQKLEKTAESFFGAEAYERQSLINSMEQMLYDEVYASPEANLYKIERVSSLEKRLEEFGHRKFAGSPKLLLRRLRHAKGSQIWGYEGNTNRWRHLVRLRFVSDGYFDRSECHVFKEELEFSRIARTDYWVAFVASYKADMGNGSYLDVYERKGQAPRNEGKLITALLAHIWGCWSDYTAVSGIPEWLSRDHLVQVFELCFQRFVPPSLKIRISEPQYEDAARVDVIRRKSHRARWSRSMSWKVKKARVSTAKAWESECLRREVRNAERGLILVANDNVILEDATRKAVAELDGVFFRIFAGNIELYIVEAKSRNNAKVAAKDLGKKLRRIGATDEEASLWIRKGKKSAVAKIGIAQGRIISERDVDIGRNP